MKPPRRAPVFTGARLQELLLAGWSILILVFLVGPLVIVFVNSLGLERMVAFPPQGLTLYWYTQIPEAFVRAFWFSLKLGIAASAAGCVLGVAGAVGIVRGNFLGRAALDAVLRMPLHVPFLVSGVAFLQFYSVIYRTTGINFMNTFTGMVVAHTAVITPYVLTAVVARLANFDRSIEEAAYGLGAGTWRTFFAITLPIIRPAIFAGTLFAFIMSFDNVPLSIFLVGSKTMTFPIHLYLSMDFDVSRMNYAAASLATVLFTTIILIFERWLDLSGMRHSASQ